MSIEKNIYPSSFKKAVVIPLHKTGSKSQCSNYRPISLTSNLSKIFEKLLKVRVINFLDKYDLIAKRQYGFRDMYNTADAINYMTEYIYSKQDSLKPVAAIFLDLKKAFDLVDHKILLNKMDEIGIRGMSNEYFKNYLRDRLQVVKIGNEYSNEEKVKCGVLQGSVLGPILFLIYINDMINLFPDEIIAFADDSTILCSGNDWIEVQKNAANKIKRVNDWIKHNKLIINVEKTVCMTFSIYNNKQPLNFQLELNGKI